ncbi:MAG: PAS domain S-box protein [Solirubrobacteraceae bacterium]
MRLSRTPPRDGAPGAVDLAALWAGAPVAAWHADADGHCLAVNPKWSELAGLPAEAALGDGWLEAVHPNDRAALIAAWHAGTATGADFDLDFHVLRPDGSTIAVHGPVSPLRDADGRVTGYIAFLNDITDRHAEQAARDRDQRGLRASEELFRTLAVAMPVGVAHRDQDGTLTFVNAEFRAILGVTADHPVEAIDFDIFHPEDRDRLMAASLHTRTTGIPYAEDARVVRPSGETRWVSFRGSRHVDDDGEFRGYLITGMDTTAQRRAESARRRADEQFRVAFDEAPIGIGMIGMDGRFERVNDAFTDLVGYTSEEMCELPPYTIVSSTDKPEARIRLLQLLDSTEETASMEFRLVHRSGREIWAESRINLLRDDDGVPYQFLMQVQDVSDRKDYEQRLKHMAHHDPLTGLVNRRGFERELDLQVARVRRYAQTGSLLMLDLDGFKGVNDSLGHAVGDALLVGVAGALVERLRETDVVARLGGDEFAVILPAESPAQSRIVATALIEAVTQACEPFHTARPVTASVGIVCFDDRITADEALVAADHAMYAAKQSGKNRFAMYDASVHATGAGPAAH